MTKTPDRAIHSITFDSELMTQCLPSTLVNKTYHLVAVADENIEPIIFAIRNVKTLSKDGKSTVPQRKKFFIIHKQNAKEGYAVNELGPMLGFKDTYEAHTLGVTQDMASGNIFLALAYGDEIGEAVVIDGHSICPLFIA
ncbi:hypothetical protein N7453_001596 [Penicillium expansum]|nr:hypothetical protein N7453_001596 [Penicillium expansum]